VRRSLPAVSKVANNHKSVAIPDCLLNPTIYLNTDEHFAMWLEPKLNLSLGLISAFEQHLRCLSKLILRWHRKVESIGVASGDIEERSDCDGVR
jgi:hypothetical protein